MIVRNWFSNCKYVLTGKPSLGRPLPSVFNMCIEVAWRCFRESEWVMGLDLLISIPDLLLSLINSIPLLNDSLRNKQHVPILPNKTREKVRLGHHWKAIPLPERERRQSKCHPLNMVMSGNNAWNTATVLQPCKEPAHGRSPHAEMDGQRDPKAWVLEDPNLCGALYLQAYIRSFLKSFKAN